MILTCVKLQLTILLLTEVKTKKLKGWDKISQKAVDMVLPNNPLSMRRCDSFLCKKKQGESITIFNARL
jgi:hypothetical protein